MKRLIIFIVFLIVLVAWFIFSTVKNKESTKPTNTEEISHDQISHMDYGDSDSIAYDNKVK